MSISSIFAILAKGNLLTPEPSSKYFENRQKELWHNHHEIKFDWVFLIKILFLKQVFNWRFEYFVWFSLFYEDKSHNIRLEVV